MIYPQKHTNGSKSQALYRVLVGLFSPDPAARLKNEARAIEFRAHLATLKARLVKLTPNYREK